MRIAIVGTRGIPANYGGFETFAEELSARLVQRGHEVAVYCREKHPVPWCKGVELRYVPTIRHKYLDTLAHSFLSTLHLLLHPVDVALYCNGANAIFTIMPRLVGMPVALNVDGIERLRKKWNKAGRFWFHASEYLATVLPTVFIADAEAIQRYYKETYKKAAPFIAYGADMHREQTTAALDSLRLKPKNYFLYVSRLEPENHALEVRQAFERVATELGLALIGDAPYAADYISRVRDTRDPRIVMPGSIYGLGYRELGSHCFAYIHATEVGGTHPALIENMGRGALVIYRATAENTEVCGDAGLPYQSEDELVDRMREAISMTELERERYRLRAAQRVRDRYDWNTVTTQYEDLFLRLFRAKSSH